MNFLYGISILLCVCVSISEQCPCVDGGSRLIKGEAIPENVCSAKNLIEAYIEEVTDGPQGYLVYKVKVIEVLRGVSKDFRKTEFLFTPLPDSICEPDIILVVGHTYILSVNLAQDYLEYGFCQFGSDVSELTKMQRDVMRKGCP